MRLLPDCQAVSRLVSEGLDSDLPAADRARVRLHFVICGSCRQVQAQMAFLRQAVRALAADEGRPPPPQPPRA